MTHFHSFSVPLRPSRRLWLAQALVHGLALVALGLSALPLWAQTPLALAVVMSGWRQWRHYRHYPYRELRVRGDDWWLLDGDGVQAVQPTGPATVLPGLISVRLLGAAPGGTRTRRLLLLADSAPAAALRRLRVRLGVG